MGGIVRFLTMDAVVFHIVAAITSADNVLLLYVTCFCKPFEEKQMTRGEDKKNLHLVSLQDPDLDTKTAARQMKADSSRHKSMHSSRVVAVTFDELVFSCPGQLNR